MTIAPTRVLAIDGSPDGAGRTARVLEAVLAGARARGAETRLVSLARGVDAELEDALAAVHAADAFVLGSPIYRASHGYRLKELLERVPRGMGGGDGAAHRPRRRPRRDGRLPPPLPRAGRPAPDAAGVLRRLRRAARPLRRGRRLRRGQAAPAGDGSDRGGARRGRRRARAGARRGPGAARGRAAGVGGARRSCSRGSWNLLSNYGGQAAPAAPPREAWVHVLLTIRHVPSMRSSESRSTQQRSGRSRLS